jgi:hypothetical protein
VQFKKIIIIIVKQLRKLDNTEKVVDLHQYCKLKGNVRGVTISFTILGHDFRLLKCDF